MAKKTAKRKTAKSTRSSPKKSAQNSLVGNINRRKKAGTSRQKKESTISPTAYSEMQKGWPKQKRQGRKIRLVDLSPDCEKSRCPDSGSTI
jgi:hypothetical protein